VLELLIEVAESYPKFLRKHLQELVSAMMQVTDSAAGAEYKTPVVQRQQHQQQQKEKSSRMITAAAPAPAMMQVERWRTVQTPIMQQLQLQQQHDDHHSCTSTCKLAQ
jgi:glutamate racemase